MRNLESMTKKELIAELKRARAEVQRFERGHGVSLDYLSSLSVPLSAVGFERLVEGIWIIDKDADTLFANNSIASMLGYTPEEMIGRNLMDFMSEDRKGDCENNISRRESGVEEVHDFEFLNKSGNPVYTRIATSPILDETGNYVGAIASVTDLSDLHQAQKQLQENFDNAPIGIAHMDLDGKLFMVNPVFSKLLGYSQKELHGMDFISMIHPYDQKDYIMFREKMLRRREQVKLSKRMVTRSGENIWVEMSFSIVIDESENPHYFIVAVSVEDISEQKRAETVMKARLELMDFSLNHSLEEVLIETVNLVEDLTNSQMGFHHYLSPDQKTLMLQAWSTRTSSEMCISEEKGKPYPVADAGVWADCIHTKRAVIHNDYVSLSNKKGLPPGHTPVIRELVVPIIRNGKVVSILGVGNKPFNYTDADIEITTNISDFAWDIIKHKKADIDLMQAKKLLEEVQKIGRIGGWEVNVSTDEIFWTDNHYQLYGYKPKEFKDIDQFFFENIIHPDDRERIFSIYMSLFKNTETVSAEYRAILKDGTEHLFHCVAAPEFDDEGKLQRVYGVNQDITDRKKVEKRLRISERKFRSYFELGLIGMAIVGADKKWIDFNNKFCEILGYSREDLEKLSWPDFTHPDDIDKNKYLFDQMVAGELDSYTIEKRYIRKNGEIVYVALLTSCTRKRDGSIDYQMAHIMDITERVKAEKEAGWNLKLNSALARLYTPLVAPEANLKNTSEAVLKEVIQVTGSLFGNASIIAEGGATVLACSNMQDECSVATKRDSLFFSKSVDGTYPGLWGHSLNTLQPFFSNDPMNHPKSKGVPSGHVALSSYLSVPVLLGDKLVGQIAVANKPGGFTQRDVDAVIRIAAYYALAIQRVNSKQEIAASKELMENILDGIQAGIIIVDPVTCVIDSINSAASKMLRASKEQIIGQRCDVICWRATDGNVIENCPAATKEIREREFRMHRMDGTGLPVSKTVLKSKVNGEDKFIEIIFDITERKELELRLSLAQKLESIGHLSAGIAHEINTPAQYLGDNIIFLSGAFEEMSGVIKRHKAICQLQKDPVCEEAFTRWYNEDMDYLLEEIPAALAQSQDGVERITRIVQAMKRFSHPGLEFRQMGDINLALDNTVTVCRNEWKYSADVVFELDPDLPLIPCFINDLNQAFLNIVVNAAHSISAKVSGSGEKGTITIRTRLDPLWVVLEIEDTGEGIPAEILPKIFDPFFTTKDVGLGTGQGLTLCYSIINEKHGGIIDFSSKLGVGTKCTIKLPLEEVKENDSL
ncbi:PAS domain S-box-containing protein [Maridesulfovibrio ferrireducens]|uniref:histidine kinase n=1 Tax=Maridesulfovibrio ferrireducens TaxID=246191 RepID=A0A1G9FTM5_9BACT|nr:PAS domain S-box protein [Maridesulfovibrio ferrireducens]SDK91744.1 PAS domain S-box-containing protein [Maridesulfovibrio ferrireducens]